MYGKAYHQIVQSRQKKKKKKLVEKSLLNKDPLLDIVGRSNMQVSKSQRYKSTHYVMYLKVGNATLFIN
jgi:hypothetical protein